MSTIEKMTALRQAGKKQREVALAVGISRSRISNMERVLKAPPLWLEWVQRGRLRHKHIETVLSLPESKAEELLRRCMQDHWTTKTLAEEVKVSKGARRVGDFSENADVAHLEQALSDMLGARVAIHTRSGGGGDLVLSYTDLDTLDGLLDRLGYKPG